MGGVKVRIARWSLGDVAPVELEAPRQEEWVLNRAAIDARATSLSRGVSAPRLSIRERGVQLGLPAHAGQPLKLWSGLDFHALQQALGDFPCRPVMESLLAPGYCVKGLDCSHLLLWEATTRGGLRRAALLPVPHPAELQPGESQCIEGPTLLSLGSTVVELLPELHTQPEEPPQGSEGLERFQLPELLLGEEELAHLEEWERHGPALRARVAEVSEVVELSEALRQLDRRVALTTGNFRFLPVALGGWEPTLALLYCRRDGSLGILAAQEAPERWLARLEVVLSAGWRAAEELTFSAPAPEIIAVSGRRPILAARGRDGQEAPAQSLSRAAGELLDPEGWGEETTAEPPWVWSSSVKTGKSEG